MDSIFEALLREYKETDFTSESQILEFIKRVYYQGSIDSGMDSEINNLAWEFFDIPNNDDSQ